MTHLQLFVMYFYLSAKLRLLLCKNIELWLYLQCQNLPHGWCCFMTFGLQDAFLLQCQITVQYFRICFK